MTLFGMEIRTDADLPPGAALVHGHVPIRDVEVEVRGKSLTLRGKIDLGEALRRSALVRINGGTVENR